MKQNFRTSITRYENSFIIPTYTQTEVGYFYITNPVIIVDVNDERAFKCALIERVGQPIKMILTPSEKELNSKKNAYWIQAGAKSWEAFAKKAVQWDIYEDDQDYIVVPKRIQKSGKRTVFVQDQNCSIRIEKNFDALAQVFIKSSAHRNI